MISDDPKNLTDAVLTEENEGTFDEKSIKRVTRDTEELSKKPSKFSSDEYQNHAELINNFTMWRDETLTMFNTKCKFIPLIINDKFEKEFNNLVDVPKCMVRLSYEVCECDSLCALDIIKDMKIDNTCIHYDLKGLTDNVVSNNCNFLRLKSYNTNILKEESQFQYSRNIYNSMDDYYYWFKDLPEVINCISYEINCDETKGFCRDKKNLQLIFPPSRLKDKLDRDQSISYAPSYKYTQRRYKRSVYDESIDYSNEKAFWPKTGDFISKQGNLIANGSKCYNISAPILVFISVLMLYKFKEISRKCITIPICLTIGLFITKFMN